jgi:hypothetical protein
VNRALKGQLVIPDWTLFVRQLAGIFEHCRAFDDGKVRA